VNAARKSVRYTVLTHPIPSQAVFQQSSEQRTSVRYEPRIHSQFVFERVCRVIRLILLLCRRCSCYGGECASLSTYPLSLLSVCSFKACTTLPKKRREEKRKRNHDRRRGQIIRVDMT
jgi:hypothetical protein